MMQLDDVYEELIKILNPFGVDISSIEIETYFERLIQSTILSKDDFLEFVRSHMLEWFKCLSYSPRWIQNSDWQFSEGQPMIFVGQVDIPASIGVFHDDSSFYTFWNNETGETKTIIQVA